MLCVLIRIASSRQRNLALGSFVLFCLFFFLVGCGGGGGGGGAWAGVGLANLYLHA